VRARAVEPPDPALLADLDDRCLRVDRLVLQIVDSLNTVLLRLAPSPERDARNQAAAALSAARELRDEFGELGIDLLVLRDAINGDSRP
jgi:phosphate uptake regulator